MFKSYWSNAYFHKIQNSYKGLIQMRHTDKSCSFEFVPVIKPVSPKDITAGMKVYNYEETKYFGLDLGESIVFSSLIKQFQENGTFPDLGEVYGTVISKPDSISVTHYPQNGVSSLILYNSTDTDHSGLYLGYTYNENKQNVFKLFLNISDVDLAILLKFLETYPTFKSAFEASTRALQEFTYVQNQDSNQTQNSNSANQQSIHQNQQSSKPSQSASEKFKNLIN